MFLTFPIMVIKVNTIEQTIDWRWWRMVGVGLGSFCLSFVWRFAMARKEAGKKQAEDSGEERIPLFQRLLINCLGQTNAKAQRKQSSAKQKIHGHASA